MDGTFVNPKGRLRPSPTSVRRFAASKVDTAGQALPGAAFSLINADTGEIVDVAASDEKGEFYLTGFGYGDWIIRETVAPEGFNRVEDVLIHVDEDWGAEHALLLTDIPNHYEFIKVDEDGCPMEGVKLRWKMRMGMCCANWRPARDGIVRADDLKPGVYIIREIETQAGYRLTEVIARGDRRISRRMGAVQTKSISRRRNAPGRDSERGCSRYADDAVWRGFRDLRNGNFCFEATKNEGWIY